MDGQRVNMDGLCDLTTRMVDWISQQREPPIIFSAYHKSGSANAPTPNIGFVYQEGAVCDGWELGGVRYPFPANHLVVLSTHMGSRSAKFEGKGGLWVCSFGLGGWEEYEELIRLYRWAPRPVHDSSRLCQAYRDVAFRYATRSPNQVLFLRAALLQLFAVVMEELNFANHTNPPIREQSTEKAVQFLHANYHKPQISLPMVASSAGRSLHHFSRVFRRQMGQAPMKYLESLRISQSQSLLINTELRVNEVAKEVGFLDPLHYSRVFNRTTGVSPRQYRLLHRSLAAEPRIMSEGG